MTGAPCSPSGAFPLISWLLITQFGHEIYQIEGHCQLLNGSLYAIVDKVLANISSKEYKHSHLVPSFWITHLILYINISYLVWLFLIL